jgi:hypothetical protein
MTLRNVAFSKNQRRREKEAEKEWEKEREEYLKLLAEYGMTEEEDEALADAQYSLFEFI